MRCYNEPHQFYCGVDLRGGWHRYSTGSQDTVTPSGDRGTRKQPHRNRDAVAKTQLCVPRSRLGVTVSGNTHIQRCRPPPGSATLRIGYCKKTS